jgi:hypothetical protein
MYAIPMECVLKDEPTIQWEDKDYGIKSHEVSYAKKKECMMDSLNSHIID